MLCLCSSISRRAWINRNANGASAQGHMIRASPSHLKVKSRKTLHVKHNKKWWYNMQSLLPISTTVSKTFLLTPLRTVVPQLYHLSSCVSLGWNGCGYVTALLTIVLPKILRTTTEPTLEICCLKKQGFRFVLFCFVLCSYSWGWNPKFKEAQKIIVKDCWG